MSLGLPGGMSGSNEPLPSNWMAVLIASRYGPPGLAVGAVLASAPVAK
jgi:hypothetical protein